MQNAITVRVLVLVLVQWQFAWPCVFIPASSKTLPIFLQRQKSQWQSQPASLLFKRLLLLSTFHLTASFEC